LAPRLTPCQRLIIYTFFIPGGWDVGLSICEIIGRRRVCWVADGVLDGDRGPGRETTRQSSRGCGPASRHYRARAFRRNVDLERKRCVSRPSLRPAAVGPCALEASAAGPFAGANAPR